MSLPQHHQLASLSSDAIQDILLFCTNDLKSVMNFASTCSEFQNLITNECSERFWLVVLMKLCDEKQSKGLKSSTLSILNSSTPNNKSKSFIKIVRTQTRYRRAHDIINQYNQHEMTNKFLFVSNLTVADPFLNKLISPIIIDSMKYSPTNIIRDICDNSPIYFISQAQGLPLKDVIDALFQKENAHLELNIKNRTTSSCLYDYWKKQEGKSSTDSFYQAIISGMYSFKFYYGYSCDTIENALLLLKLIYLEFPTIQTVGDYVTKTGYEQEKESRGSFKKQLNFLKTNNNFNNAIFKAGLLEFEKLLYN